MTSSHKEPETRKEREFLRRETDILDAALSLFNRDDWQAVTIDQVAAKAGIGKGTVYKHFDSKDQIYARLAIVFFEGILAKMRALDPRGPVLGYLSEVMAIFWRTHHASPEYRRLIRYCRREDFRRIVGDRVRGEMDALDEAFLGLISPVMERGIREKVLVDRPVPFLIMGLHAAMIGLLEMEGIECMKAVEVPKEEMFEQVKEFCLRGVSRSRPR